MLLSPTIPSATMAAFGIFHLQFLFPTAVPVLTLAYSTADYYSGCALRHGSVPNQQDVL